METQELARDLLDIVPKVMRHFREEMRARAEHSLSIPQFRVLIQLSMKPAYNCDLAEVIGVSVPAMSKMVDQLVKKGLVSRVPGKTDRRQIELSLTTQGKKQFRSIFDSVQGHFSEKIAKLNREDRKRLSAGLVVLHSLFF